MASTTQAAYDAFLDATKGTQYYLSPTEPADATALAAAKLNSTSPGVTNGANGAGTPNGRQYTVPAVTGIAITKDGSVNYVVQATGSGNDSDVPTHSVDVDVAQAVTVGQTVNVGSYVMRIGALASA